MFNFFLFSRRHSQVPAAVTSQVFPVRSRPGLLWPRPPAQHSGRFMSAGSRVLRHPATWGSRSGAARLGEHVARVWRRECTAAQSGPVWRDACQARAGPGDALSVVLHARVRPRVWARLLEHWGHGVGSLCDEGFWRDGQTGSLESFERGDPQLSEWFFSFCAVWCLKAPRCTAVENHWALW